MSNKAGVSLSGSTTTEASPTSEFSSKLEGSSLPSSTVLAIALKLSPLQNKSDVRVYILLDLKVVLDLHSNSDEI